MERSMITLPKPTSLNLLYGTNRFGGKYITNEGRAWKEEAGYKLKAQWKKKTIEKDVGLYIKVYYCGKYDIDNCLKILLDLFSDMQVYKDDRQITFLQIEKIRVPHRINQKIEVEVV